MPDLDFGQRLMIDAQTLEETATQRRIHKLAEAWRKLEHVRRVTLVEQKPVLVFDRIYQPQLNLGGRPKWTTTTSASAAAEPRAAGTTPVRTPQARARNAGRS